jgi:hypothetical protein
MAMGLQWLQVGVDLVVQLVAVTLEPRGRNVVFRNKYGPPKIVNDRRLSSKEVLPFSSSWPVLKFSIWSWVKVIILDSFRVMRIQTFSKLNFVTISLGYTRSDWRTHWSLENIGVKFVEDE